MERYDLTFRRGFRPAWEGVPAAAHRCVFGVDYVSARGMQGGELFFTSYGWRLAEHLLPQHWFNDRQYRLLGRRLEGSTGAVYKFPQAGWRGDRRDLVIKFSRVAQHPGEVYIWPEVAGAWTGGTMFLSPFEEFANLNHLRLSGPDACIPTQLPLAIYSPPLHFHDWQLGRHVGRFSAYDRRLEADQTEVDNPPVHYEWDRLYILLYGWLDGVDVEEAHENGRISKASMEQLSIRVDGRLACSGLVVLDHKPRHIIVRPAAQTGLRKGRADVLYGLVDYELLVGREGTVFPKRPRG